MAVGNDEPWHAGRLLIGGLRHHASRVSMVVVSMVVMCAGTVTVAVTPSPGSLVSVSPRVVEWDVR